MKDSPLPADDADECQSQVSSTEATSSSVPSPFNSPPEQILGTLPGQIPPVAAAHSSWHAAAAAAAPPYAPSPDATATTTTTTGEVNPYVMPGQVPSNPHAAQPPPSLSPQPSRPQSASPPMVAGQDLGGLEFQFPHHTRFAPAGPSSFPAQLSEQSMVAGHHHHHPQGIVPMELSAMGYDTSSAMVSPTTSPEQQQIQQQQPPISAPQTTEVYQEHVPTMIPSSGVNNPYICPP